MPWGDGTGPLGLGPMTGRGLGYCAGYATPGFMNPGFGRGFARGFARGFGRGFRFRRFWRFFAPVFFPQVPLAYPEPLSKEEQKRILEEEKRELEAELAEINKRLEELSK